MKSTFNKSAIAMAVAALAASGSALAQEVSSETTNVVDVEMTKQLSLSKNITINGDIVVRGRLEPDSSALAVIDDKQFNSGNNGPINSNGPAQNLNLSNEASSSDDMLNGATGNIGVNMNGGDNNMQDNAAALASAADTNFVFGLVDAEVFVHQDAHQNITTNQSVDNTARIGQRSFQSAEGNIGANFAAGNSNLQKNNFASSVAHAGSAEASVNTQQYSTANITTNRGLYIPGTNGEPGPVSGVWESAPATLTGALDGVGDGTMAGTYGDLNLATNEETGTFVEGGTGEGSYSSSHDGSISADEDSDYDLNATFTTEAFPYFRITDCGFCAAVGATTFATNTVRLDNQAFMGASGNIGANLASGSGNLQSNSLAMTATTANSQ